MLEIDAYYTSKKWDGAKMYLGGTVNLFYRFSDGIHLSGKDIVQYKVKKVPSPKYKKDDLITPAAPSTCTGTIMQRSYSTGHSRWEYLVKWNDGIETAYPEELLSKHTTRLIKIVGEKLMVKLIAGKKYDFPQSIYNPFTYCGIFKDKHVFLDVNGDKCYHDDEATFIKHLIEHAEKKSFVKYVMLYDIENLEEDFNKQEYESTIPEEWKDAHYKNRADLRAYKLEILATEININELI